MKANQISLGLAVTLLIAGCGGSAQTTSTTESTESINTTAVVPSTAPTAEEPTTSTDAGTSGGGDDVCALLGTEDLAAAAGGSWGEPLDASEPGQYDLCYYSLVGEVAASTEQSVSLDVTVYHEEHLAGVGGVEATFERYVPQPGVIEIEAGDGAFFDPTLLPIWQVYMLAGGAVVSIVGFSSSADIVFDQESATTIASIVAGNL